MTDVFFDPWGAVAYQATDPDITGATEDQLETALGDLFITLARDAAEAKYHDRTGYFAEHAGSDKRKALGHTWDDGEDSWMPYDSHPRGWDFDAICDDTRYGAACSVCEREDCEGGPRLDVRLWSAPGVTGGGHG